mgnify:CR=1 FL=1
MKKIIINHNKNYNTYELNVYNYFEMLAIYNARELNKRIINYILKYNLNFIILNFQEIPIKRNSNLSEFLSIIELFIYFDISLMSIKISFVKN